MRNLAKTFFSNEKGLETIEYAMIVGLITAAVIVTVANIAIWLEMRFGTLLETLNSDSGN